MEKHMVRLARFFMIVSSVLILSCLIGATPAQSQTSQDILKKYVADLQKNPDDYALREKIIRHVQTMRPAPVISEEARRQYVMGKTLFEDAKNVQDFNDAIEKFRKALLIAPWWPDANRDLGMALQAAQQYGEAIYALKLYMATHPGDELLRRTQNEIYKIEAKQEKAAKESSPAAIAAKKQKEYEDWLKKIDGRRYTYRESFERITHVLDVKGKLLIQGAIVDPDSPFSGPRGYTEHNRYEIRGRVVEGPVINTPAEIKSVQAIFTISEDGEKIHLEKRLGVGKGREYDYYWQR
jgi:tetratricopeptide (TPR) repeat protein